MYVAYINTANLKYNRIQAYESARIAEGLKEINREIDILNRSGLMYEVKNELRKEKNDAEL